MSYRTFVYECIHQGLWSDALYLLSKYNIILTKKSIYIYIIITITYISIDTGIPVITSCNKTPLYNCSYYYTIVH